MCKNAPPPGSTPLSEPPSVCLSTTEKARGIRSIVGYLNGCRKYSPPNLPTVYEHQPLHAHTLVLHNLIQHKTYSEKSITL